MINVKEKREREVCGNYGAAGALVCPTETQL